MATLIDDEEIPTPEAIPQGFYASEPAMPAGTMNAQVLPQVYGTASDNAYLSEQRALAGLDPRYARQQALMQADLAEQTVRTEGQLGYQKDYESLRKGGANEEEAAARAYYANAGKLNWNHPDKLALGMSRVSVPGAVPESVNSVPILGDQGARIGDAVYGAKGQLHATRFANPNAITPEQKLGEKATQRDLDDARRALNHLQRQAEGMGGIGNKELPGQITVAQAAYDQLKKNAAAGAASKAESTKTVIKYDKNHKGWIVDETTKKVLGPANQ